MVLPTPGGPINSTLVASSRNRSVPSSFISFLSTEGWAEKSKSSSVHGEGRQAKRSSPARRRISVAVTSTSRRRCKNSRVSEPSGPGMVELSGQRLGGGSQTQVGQVGADLLIGGGLAHLSLRDLAIDGEVDDGLTPDGPEQPGRLFERLFARRAVGLLVARTRRGEGAEHGRLEGLFVLDTAHQGTRSGRSEAVGDEDRSRRSHHVDRRRATRRCRTSSVVPPSPGGTE